MVIRSIWRALWLGALALTGCGSTGDAGPSDADGVPATGGPSRTFGLNDVSFLYPLPSWNARDTLLAADAIGAGGPLVPRAIYDQLSLPLIESLPAPQNDLYPTLRVVGVRVDPCFPADASATPACSKQIRLVLQPIAQDVNPSELTTLDAAVHALFNLDDDAWSALVADLGSLQDLAGGLTLEAPLAVHPVLQQQGLEGQYAQALRTLILKYAGEATLGQLAFMVLTKKDKSWKFTQAAKVGASFGFVEVPLVSATSQLTTVLLMDESADPTRTIILAPEPNNPWLVQLADLSAVASSIEAALREALLMDNPTSAKNPQTVDCGSCHLATRNRAYAERAHGIDTSTWPERFVESGYDLTRADEIGDDPRSLRSFGYFERQSSIAGRTIHESALVARALSR